MGKKLNRKEFIKGEAAAIWRTNHSLNRNGDLYPAHGLGPISTIFDINRGNRFVSLTSTATKSRGLNEYIKQRGQFFISFENVWYSNCAG